MEPFDLGSAADGVNDRSLTQRGRHPRKRCTSHVVVSPFHLLCCQKPFVNGTATIGEFVPSDDGGKKPPGKRLSSHLSLSHFNLIDGEGIVLSVTSYG